MNEKDIVRILTDLYKDRANPKSVVMIGTPGALSFNKTLRVFFADATVTTEKKWRSDLQADLIISIQPNYNQTSPLFVIQKCKLLVVIKPKGNPVLPGEKPRRRLRRSIDKEMYRKYHMQPVLREPFLRPNILSNAKGLMGKLPYSIAWSPYDLLAYESTDSLTPLRRYVKKTSLMARISRVSTRVSYSISNHPINDRINKIKAFLRSIPVIGIRLYYRRFGAAPSRTQIISTDSKNVGVITGQLAIGGVERVLLGISKRLIESGYKVHIYTTEWNSNLWKPLFISEGVIVRELPQKLGHSWPKKYIKHELMKSLSGDKIGSILISNSLDGYEVLPMYLQAVDKFEAIDLLHTHGKPAEKDAFLRLSSPYDHLLRYRVVISHYLKDYLVHKYGVADEKVKVVYNEAPIVDTGRSMLAALGGEILDSRRKYVTFLGRLQPDKSPERLVKLAYIMRKHLENAGYAIAVFGEGLLKEELVAQAKELNILNKVIYFFDPTDQPLAVASASRFTILTSDLEGIPMTILESMSAGTPSISTAVGGVPEIIAHGVNGLLADLGDTEEETINNLASSIDLALSLDDDAWREMSHSAKHSIHKKFANTYGAYSSLFD